MHLLRYQLDKTTHWDPKLTTSHGVILGDMIRQKTLMVIVDAIGGGQDDVLVFPLLLR